MDNPFYYLLAFGLAFLVSLLMTPVSKKIAYYVGAIDQPKKRGMHNKPMPLAGGTAIIFGFYFSVLVISVMNSQMSLKSIFGLLIGGIIIGVIGLFDDMHDLSPKLRLVIQFGVALIVVFSGVIIERVGLPFFNDYIKLGIFKIPFTILWIVGVTNAVNWIDGLDGLAAGVSSIASLMLMFLALLNVNNPMGPIIIILSAALAGACLGFLPHNFNPATIFMGSTGSTFLGFSLAVISIQGYTKSQTALVIAVLILGLPIFDTLFAILRRLFTGKSIMQADRGHIHHRLVDKGYSQKKAVLTLYGISGCFGIAGILFAEAEIVLAGLLVAVLLYVMLKGNIKLTNVYKK